MTLRSSGARPAPPSSGPRLQGCAMAQWPCGRCASPKGPPSAGVGGPAAARRACARNLHFRVGKCAPGGGPCRARDIFWATPISSRRERSTWRLSAPRAKLSRGARTIFYKFQPTVANCLARRAGDCREGSLPFHLERARIYFARSAAVGVCFVRRSVAVTRARCVYVLSLYTRRAKRAERFARCTIPRAKRAERFARFTARRAKRAK